MYRKIIIIGLICINIFAFSWVIFSDHTVDIEETISRYGSTGSEVRKIQQKLKSWGYYNGDIDGIFGSRTLTAVKNFQRKNGLNVDGIAGTQTLQAMGLSSSSGSSRK